MSTGNRSGRSLQYHLKSSTACFRTQETQIFCSSPSDSEISSPFENHATGRPLPYPRSTGLPLLADVMLYLRMDIVLSNITEAEIQRPSYIWVELSDVAVV